MEVEELNGSTCPICKKVCKTLAGLSKHMNATHLVLSPNQKAQGMKVLDDQR